MLEDKFDYIFFTGSPAVGHLVMEPAEKHLTPVPLELGGKRQSCVFTVRNRKNPFYSCIINQKHFGCLRMLMEGGTILQGGAVNLETRQIAPTLIDGVCRQPYYAGEIFGPLLPVLSFETIADARSFVAERPKSLALYLFSRDKTEIAQTMNELSFGGG